MLEFDNKEVVNEFLVETLSGFDTVENTLVQLESNPENLDLINIIFRPIHSLKGNSAYFGLFKVKTLTHNLEDLLDATRKGKIKITSEIISLLLSSIDYLKEMITRVENDEDEVIDENNYEIKLKNINIILEEHEKPFVLSITEKTQILKILNEIKTESSEYIQNKIDNVLSTFQAVKKDIKEKNTGKDNKNIEKLTEILTTPFAEFEANDNEITEIQDLINNLQIKNNDGQVIEFYDKLKDNFETLAYNGIGIDDVGQEIIFESLTELIDVAEFINDDTESKPTTQEQKTEISTINSLENSKVGKKTVEQKIEPTIRIKEKSLDDFLNNVAELLSIEELFSYISFEINKYDLNLSSTFKHHLDDFSRISGNLRKGIMDIRKVEASTLLQKVPRLVRDIASKANKKINVKILGDKIKIDKSYIELLDSPIVHMVRNAADHGIELTEDRKKTGKDETGNITVSIVETEKNIFLHIEDDGKGLDQELLKLKAIEKGFIKQNQELQESDIIKLLFQSGISTAKEITDVSGRGVGMDVVKTAIESANGKIYVETKSGSGSKFSIELPKNVSTKINEVYLVKSFSDEIYALPLKLVEEAFTVSREELFSVTNQGKVLIRRDNILSVLVIDEIFNENINILDESYSKDINLPFVYVNFPKKPMALLIKDVVGVQTIVVKDIDSLKLNTNIFEGGATLANGKIALLIRQEWLENYSKI